MARHGTAQHSTAWHGMAWHGTAWHGMAGMARHSTRLQCMHAVALAASFKMNRKRESVQVHALMMPGGKPQMESTPASPTSQTAGVKMAVLDPTGILTGAGLRGSMARMHGVLAAHAGKASLRTRHRVHQAVVLVVPLRCRPPAPVCQVTFLSSSAARVGVKDILRMQPQPHGQAARVLVRGWQCAEHTPGSHPVPAGCISRAGLNATQPLAGVAITTGATSVPTTRPIGKKSSHQGMGKCATASSVPVAALSQPMLVSAPARSPNRHLHFLSDQRASPAAMQDLLYLHRQRAHKTAL